MESRSPVSRFVPRFWMRALHVATVLAFALAQPLLSLLSGQATFLVAHDLDAVDLVLLAVFLALVVPGALGVLAGLAGSAGPRWACWSYAAGLAAGVAVGVSQGLEGRLDGALAVAAAIAFGGLAAWLASSSSVVRSTLTVAAAGLVVFPLAFLSSRPVRQLWQRPEVVVAGGPGGATPVVVLLLDELPLASLLDPSEEIDQRLYPGFARLAATSTWYRRATAVAAATAYAVPALLTARYPDEPREPTAAAYPRSLFTFLGGRLELHVDEELTRLCPASLCAPLESSRRERLVLVLADLGAVALHRVLPPSYRGGLPDVDATWGRFWSESSERRPAARIAEGERFERWVSEIPEYPPSTLHFLHAALPHVPWHYLPSGQQYGPADEPVRPHGLTGESWDVDEWATIQAYQRHLLQLLYVDRLLDRLLDTLERAAIAERCLLIVTADHGAAFWPGENRRNPTPATAADIARVPLFVRYPGQIGPQVVDAPAELVDLLPTIAETLGLPFDWPVDGVSLRSAGAARRQRIVPTKGQDPQAPLWLGEAELRLDRVLQRKHALFGSGDPDRIYRVGPFLDLHGRLVSSLASTVPTATGWALKEERLYRDLDPSAAYLPSHLAGTLELSGPAAPERPLAVAIDGRVVATTHAFRGRRGGWEWTASVPPATLRAGENRVELFEIDRLADGSARLAPVAAHPGRSYRLKLDRKGRVRRIRTGPDQPELVVDGESVEGAVWRRGGRWVGWAAEPGSGRLAEAVLLFDGGHYVASIELGGSEERTRPADGRGRAARFSFPAPHRVAASSSVRFYAVLDGRASELPIRSEPPAGRRDGAGGERPPRGSATREGVDEGGGGGPS